MTNAIALRSAAIIGLGALGVMFGNQMQRSLGSAFHIIVDAERQATYATRRVTCNGDSCLFKYITPQEAAAPIDLIIFGTKYNGLQTAIETARPFVGEDTIVMSILNGIASEEMLADAYGKDKVLYAIAHGMDARRVGGDVEYTNMGCIEFGEGDGSDSARVHAVAAFLDSAGVPTKTTTGIQNLFWGKLMTNVGINQTVTAYEVSYRDVQRPGEARDTMIAAMREVVAISQKNGVNLTESDLQKWLSILDKLDPDSYPSMRQDALARRETEVEMFAGTIMRLGKQYGVPTPVNERLYAKITSLPVD
uniref:2-dehydropantoate 2-reductase n=1 Tax=Herpetomonas muscarum TaxID=5718 RepID=T1YSS2_HERMU|nr:2-dehydropantoate 2-reductase [Herpetomonas muscarum]